MNCSAGMMRHNLNPFASKAMLKIFIAETPTQCLLVLKGRLVGSGVSGLLHIGSTLMSRRQGRALVIDMKEVTGISQEAENLLLELVLQGARIRTHGVLATGDLQHLVRRSNKQWSELVDTCLADMRADGINITLGGPNDGIKAQ